MEDDIDIARALQSHDMAAAVAARSKALIAKLFASDKYSDLIITCKGRSFKVHRAIVCLQSKPIAAMMDGNFREAREGVIDLPENDPHIVERMIHFMYHGDYPDGRVAEKPFLKLRKHRISRLTSQYRKYVPSSTYFKRVESPVGSNVKAKFDTTDQLAKAFLLNARMYAIAEQYDIQALKEHAKIKYAAVAPDDWTASAFAESLKLIYETTPESDRGLKDVALATASEHCKTLLNCAEFATLCRGNGEICFDVLQASVNFMSEIVSCPSCRGFSTFELEIGSEPSNAFQCTKCYTTFRIKKAEQIPEPQSDRL